MEENMFNKSKITSAFQAVNSEGLIQVNEAIKTGTTQIDSSDGLDLRSLLDVLETFEMEGNYRVLSMCINYMRDLYPEDITMFFDDFTSIEEAIFKEHGVSYEPIKEAYRKNRGLIVKDYIEFIYGYYPDGARAIYAQVKDYNKEQMDFIINRNLSMIELLPDIGTKLSRGYYGTVIVNDVDTTVLPSTTFK